MFKKENPKKSEFDEYLFLIEAIKDETIKNRTKASLKYFLSEAKKWKRVSTILSFATIILPTVATFLSCFDLSNCKYVIPSITAVTTIISSIIAYLKSDEKKNSSRNSAESIKSELAYYLTSSGTYKNNDDEASKILLAENIEKILKEGYSKIREIENKEKG